MSSLAEKAGGLGEGVFYSPNDYIGFVGRVLIIVIDLAVLLAIWFVLAVVLIVLEAANLQRWLYYTWLPVVWAYLTLVEAGIGTLGFLLTQAKVVTIRGERPSVFRMTFRLLLWTIGPFNLLFDLIWLAGDRRRQTLRDTIAGTYVVRKDASPAGKGNIRLSTLMVLGLNLSYPEVREPGSRSPP